MRNSTVHGNTSGLHGGGIENVGGTLNMLNCTVAHNTANDDAGGIDNFYGTVSLTNCTLAGNQAATGGGIWSNSSLTFIDCIVASNTASSGPDISYHGGTVTPNGVNLISDLSTSSLAASASVLVDALLLANLGNYGGPTPTMPPLLGSPAIDASPTSASATGQRGVPRPYGGVADIGAVEVVAFVVSNNTDSDAGSLRSTLAEAAAYSPSVRTLVSFDAA